MATRAIADWDLIWSRWAERPPHERVLTDIAKAEGMQLTTVEKRASRDRWKARWAAFDQRAQERREENSIRALNLRLADDIRIVEAARIRYAKRLQDPGYQMTAQEFYSMARLELLIEGRETSKLSIGLSPEFKAALERLPPHVQDRLMVAATTGASLEDIMEVEATLVEEEDE